MSQRKKQGFVEGAAILTASTILIKILGAVFKIPLSNIIGKSAMGDFGVAYNIYALLLTLSTAGLQPVFAELGPGFMDAGGIEENVLILPLRQDPGNPVPRGLGLVADDRHFFTGLDI